MSIYRRVKSSLVAKLPWGLWGPAWKMSGALIGRKQAFRSRNVGANSYVDPSVQVFGYQNLFVGANSAISADSLINVNSRGGVIDQIRIGSNCHVGRRNYFSSGGLIELKDYVLTGLDCHFLGCGHNTDSPLNPYVSTGLTLGAPISIGVNCWLTTSVTVLEGVTIGHGSVVGARSIVTVDLPKFSVALGAPSRVVKRYDFKNNVWLRLAEWKDSLDEYMPNESEYREELISRRPSVPLSIHAASTRFGWLR
jgi:acetyltransferase-like isoleucine patch superfamily enzyme